MAKRVIVALCGSAAIGALGSRQPTTVDQDVIEVVDALYASISGPAGSHDFTDFKAIFDERGDLTAIVHRQDGPSIVRMTPDEWIERSGAWIQSNGFYETGLHNKVEVFGHIAHVWSTYDSKRTPEAEPFARGINSIQLLKDPASGEWKVLSILWDSETPDQPIPAHFLPQISREVVD